MIHVIATVELKPGTREAFLAEFAKLIAPVRAEDGCIEYVPVIDADGFGAFQTKLGPDTFMVVEKWRDAAALKAHAAAPHMAAYGARVKGMVKSRVIHVLSPA